MGRVPCLVGGLLLAVLPACRARLPVEREEVAPPRLVFQEEAVRSPGTGSMIDFEISPDRLQDVARRRSPGGRMGLLMGIWRGVDVCVPGEHRR